jgi:hypothetical protein
MYARDTFGLRLRGTPPGRPLLQSCGQVIHTPDPRCTPNEHHQARAEHPSRDRRDRNHVARVISQFARPICRQLW